MKKFVRFALMMAAGTACGAALADGPFEEWEMTSTVTMAGMPDLDGPGGMSRGQKMIVCQKKMDRTKAPPPPPESNCTMTHVSGSPAKGTFEMVCKGNPPKIPPSTMKGEGSSTADTMEGKMVVTTNGQDVTINYSGKRTGSCDKEGSRMASSPMAPGMGMDMNAMMAARKRAAQGDGGGSGGNGARDSRDDAAQQPAQKAPEQDDKKEEPKDAAGKAVDAAKKAIGGLLNF